MRKLILVAFLAVCICAYPQKHNFDIKFDKIILKNNPDVKEKLTNQFQKTYEKLRDEGDCNLEVLNNATLLNACVDSLFTTVDGLLAESYDPFPMPDMHSSFNYTLIITYHGELDLTNGKLQDFSTIHRGGEVVLNPNLLGTSNFTLPMAFNELAFTYDYSAKIMGLGPTGGIEGNVNNLAMEVEIGYDIFGNKLTLQTFEITNSGHINFEFTGHALVDWLLNLLSDVVTALLKKVILSIMEDVVGGALQAAVDAINEGLANNTVSAVDSLVAEKNVYNRFL